MQDEFLLYPILNRDLSNNADDAMFFPILASDIIEQNHLTDVTKNMATPNYGENEGIEDMNNVPEYVNTWVSIFADTLMERGFSVATEAEPAVARMFMYAVETRKMENQILYDKGFSEMIVTTDDVNQYMHNEFGVKIETKSIKKETNLTIYDKYWINAFEDRLGKDQIRIETDARETLAQLFRRANDDGDIIIRGRNADEYIETIVVKMENQLTFKCEGDTKTVTIEDVKQLYKNLFGDVPERKTVVEEDKSINDTSDVCEGKEMESLPDNKSYVQDNTENTELAGCATALFDVLKESGRYPLKKDEQKNAVPNMYLIEKAANAISVGEQVLMAFYTEVAYCRAEKVKRTKQSTLKCSFLDNLLRVVVITENHMILSSYFDSEKGLIVVPKSLVVKIEHVLKKTILSLGQTQITLSDGNVIVISIDRVNGDVSEQEQYDTFINKIDKAIRSNCSEKL